MKLSVTGITTSALGDHVGLVITTVGSSIRGADNKQQKIQNEKLVVDFDTGESDDLP